MHFNGPINETSTDWLFDITKKPIRVKLYPTEQKLTSTFKKNVKKKK